MLTTVAVLVVILGLMVSLARYVRERSSQVLTKDLLRQLDSLMTDYVARHRGTLPQVGDFPPPESSSEANDLVTTAPKRAARQAALDNAARNNNEGWVKLFKADGGAGQRVLADLPPSLYKGERIYDAWGQAIVFMPAKHPSVGTAPRDKAYFFFSAGPDRDYLSRFDNLYSYEEITARR
jgi:hypothetical protein